MFNILQYKPIQELWKESYVAVNSIESTIPNSINGLLDNIFNVFMIIVISVLFVINYRRIVDGLYYSFLGIVSKKTLLTIENQLNIQVCRNTLFSFLLFVICFVLANYINTMEYIGRDLYSILKFVLLFTLCILAVTARKYFLRIISWVNENSVFNLINKLFYTYAIIYIFLLLFGFMILNILGNDYTNLMFEYSLFCALAVILIYNITTYKLIIANRFSHFFYILYLCTLEILPLAIFWRIIFN